MPDGPPTITFTTNTTITATGSRAGFRTAHNVKTLSTVLLKTNSGRSTFVREDRCPVAFTHPRNTVKRGF